MALIGNRSVLHKSPTRFLAGTVASGDRDNFNKPGMLRGSQAAYGRLAAIPNGYGSTSWMMPVKAGSISSSNAAVMTVSQSASGAMGLPGDGTSSFTIDFATADGGLISSGTGTASFAITSTATVLATRSGDGSASFAINTNTPLLGALGWVTATGAFSVTTTLQSYARGYMTGTTVDNTTLTAAALIAAMNADPPKVNIAKVNDVVVTGTGAVGDEWGP